MTIAETSSQIAKEITIAFAGHLHLPRVAAGQNDEFNEKLTQTVTKFYEAIYNKVYECATKP